MIKQQEYLKRRQTLAQMMVPGAIAIIPAAGEVLRNGDVHYRFRQDSDFFYLTGFNEPDALLLISAVTGEATLFTLPKDEAKEQWTGLRLGQDDALSVLKVDNAYPLNELENRLVELIAGHHAVYYPVGRYALWEQRILDAWNLLKPQARRGVRAPDVFYDVAPLLGEMRLFKSHDEIELMRKAAHISVAAHQRAMRACRHARFEYELEAELVYELTRQGCRSVAYDPIVASGENACILHYNANNQPLSQDGLVLIDAGGEYAGYAADITRTFPASGKFTPEQRTLYNLVRQAQKAGIECVRPGCVWDDIQRVMVRILTTGLVELGILTGDIDDLLANKAYLPFYMHGSGHWLGLDVHDVGSYRQNETWRKLEPGMVLTVEPGLYFHPHLQQIDSKWSGMGIRIEDDILVTADGFENLTSALPADANAIEALIRD